MTLQKKKDRVFAIDNFRGLIIIYMMFIHALEFWLQKSDNWMWGVVWLIFDVIGTAAFVFTSGISLSLSYHAQQRRIKRDPNYFSKHAHMNFAIRTFWLAIIAFVTHMLNFFINQGDMRHWWFWETIQTLVMARLFCYFFLKISPPKKFLIGLVFFLISDPLNAFISGNIPILSYVICEPPVWNTPFPFFGFSFIGCAIGDWINSWSQQQTDSKQIPKIIQPRNLLIMGLCSIGFAISIGFQLIESESTVYLINQINRYEQAGWQWPSDTLLPVFLVRSTGAWGFYTLGYNFIVLAFFLRKDLLGSLKNKRSNALNIPIEEKIEPQKNPSKFLSVFGVWSLTIFHVQFISFVIFVKMLWWPIFIIPFIIYLLLFFGLMKIWTNSRYGKSIGTFEWVIKTSAIYIVTKSIEKSQK